MNRTPSSTPVRRAVGRDLGQVHERGDEQERHEVGRRVDVEDVRRADQADQDAGERRAEEDRRAVRRLEERRRLRDVGLLLADELRARPRAAPRSTARGRRRSRRRARAAAGNGRAPAACSARDRGEQRHAREVAHEHRPPRADAAGDRAAPEAEHGDREDLGDDHPRHPLRRVRWCAARTTAARATSSASPSTRSPRRRAARRAGGRAAGSRLGRRAEADDHACACRAGPRGRGTRRAAPRTARRAPRAPSASARASPTTSAPRGASAAGSSCSRRSASRTRCCWRATSSSRSTVASSPSDGNSMRVAVARHGRSRPAPPLPSLDEAPLRERAQVVAARGRALVDELRALGRGRLVDRVQVVEQREPRRVGERAHRARVGQGECVIERDLSKLSFREPGVKDRLLLRPVEPGRRCRPERRRAATHASVSRTVSSSGRGSSPAANAADGSTESIAGEGRVDQPERQLHPLADLVLGEERRRRPRRSPRRRRRRAGTSRRACARGIGRSTAL